MAVYDLEEQEQLDEIKTWWTQYGNLVTGLVTAAAIAVAAWQGWNAWQRHQSAGASAIFASLQQAAGQKDAKRSRELAGELIDKYSGTAYAGMGALLAARIQIDSDDAKNARVQLAWAADNAVDPGLRDLARLRLATVLLDEKDYDEAARRLAAEPAAPFALRFAELRGDVLAAQGKTAEARAAYDVALKRAAAKDTKAESGEATKSHSAYMEVLEAKRHALGATPAVATPAAPAAKSGADK
ncbi:MAG TPA: tetratricopeptide repeat protein [Rhodocyclaceae bacterium]|nr:tetratricopeptide repeat protein [Rhodocyclaceae bacterium]